MTATLTAAHTFTASAEDRRRCECGKSRNTAAHGYDKNARAAAKAAPAVTPAAAEVLTRHAENPDTRVTTDPAELTVIAERAALLDALPTEEDVQEEGYLTAAEVAAKVSAEAAEEQRWADAREARTTELAERVAAGELTFDAAAAELLGGSAAAYAAPVASGWNNPHAKAPAVLPSQERKAAKPAAPRGRKVEPGTRALWVARELVTIILDSTDPAHAVIVRKLSSVIPNNRGGRTIRLTAAEAELLSGMATEIETAVLDASVQADGAGRLARSCVTMRARLAALWA